MRPGLHMLRLYGPKNGLIMDDQQQTLIKMRGAPYKSYLEQFLPQWAYARQFAGASVGNILKFLKADFQTGYGMKFLIHALYRAISEDGRVPIPYPEILRTSWIMEEIFSQLNAAQSASEPKLAAQMVSELNRGKE